MTGKEIVNLIDKLRSEGVDDTKIIDTIRYIELADPHTKAIIDETQTENK